MKFNWKLALMNLAGIYFLAWMGGGLLVPIVMFYAVFVCDYRVRGEDIKS